MAKVTKIDSVTIEMTSHELDLIKFALDYMSTAGLYPSIAEDNGAHRLLEDLNG